MFVLQDCKLYVELPLMSTVSNCDVLQYILVTCSGSKIPVNCVSIKEEKIFQVLKSYLSLKIISLKSHLFFFFFILFSLCDFLRKFYTSTHVSIPIPISCPVTVLFVIGLHLTHFGQLLAVVCLVVSC